VNVLAVAYRGYSDSDGFPNESGLKKDGLVIARYINLHKDELVKSGGNFFLLGRSLGGAVASYVASHEDVPQGLFSGLILENTFTSISDMVDQLFFFPVTTFKK
jgi:hypothetical protein